MHNNEDSNLARALNLTREAVSLAHGIYPLTTQEFNFEGPDTVPVVGSRFSIRRENLRCFLLFFSVVCV